jgi:hypothetical protein
VLSKLAYLTLCRSIQALALAARGDAAKDLEILVLRHQLAVLRRQIPRPKLEPADRALLAAVSRVLPRAHWSCFLVKPDTLLGWHRRLVAGVWTYPHRQTGRPQLDRDVQDLIVRLARENPRWGYQRIQGELLRRGVQVSATAIRTTLDRCRCRSRYCRASLGDHGADAGAYWWPRQDRCAGPEPSGGRGDPGCPVRGPASDGQRYGCWVHGDPERTWPCADPPAILQRSSSAALHGELGTPSTENILHQHQQSDQAPALQAGEELAR